jgi:SAM-dependent methyltransferase
MSPGFRNSGSRASTYNFQGRKFKISDYYLTSNGNRISRLEGFREYLKPDWREMVCPASTVSHLLKTEDIERRMNANIKKINNLRTYLDLYGIDLKNKDILEIGCYSGAATYCLSLLNPSRVTGSDVSKYYINQSKGQEISDKTISKQFDILTESRNATKEYLMRKNLIALSGTDFVEDDITRSCFAPDSFDFICGWEVLEHVNPPQKALSEMYRILRPGGFVFHEYNPFFCLEGGHTLCTLEFPWGHARLSAEDFRRYVDQFRKDEASQDLSFYNNNLNRMTIRDMMSMTEKAGFDIIEILKWSSTKLIPDILNDPQIYCQCRENYSTITLDDLITEKIWMLLRKKDQNS